MSRRVFDEVIEFAAEHQGVVTTKDASALGVDPANLRVMASRGRLERVGRGAYRVPTLPIGALSPFAEAAAWAAGRAVVSHESALLVREIGVFGGSRIDLTVRPDYRLVRAVPRRLRVWVEDLAESSLEVFEGVPTVTVATALGQVVDNGSDPFQVHAAIRQAARAGFIDPRAGRRLRYRLDRPSARRGDAGPRPMSVGVDGR